MKRIFYYSGYRLTVFHWNNEKCVATYAFNPGDEGIEKFRTYLLATDNSPVRILIDLIEEDFKKDSIPHVGAADRKSIVQRLIERHYRKSRDFVQYSVVGREKTGRRDDILLYSVLSNPEILDPWLKPIKETGTAISGIWSLPLLGTQLFRKLEKSTRNVLMVSQQVPSNLRQTFIKNGQFETSRSAVVNLEEASIGEYIATEVEQTIRFLSNQRQIGFDDKIDVHILCRDADLADIQSRCSDVSLRRFHYHKLDDIEHKLNCDTQSVEYCSGIYSFICSQQLLPLGHYGNRSLFSKYYEYLLSNTLNVASAFLLIAAVIISFSYVSNSILMDEEAITFIDERTAINKDYNKHLSKLEHKLAKTQMMQSAVLLKEKIQANKIVSPQNFMVDISKILSRTGMRDTEITSIKWQQNQSNDFPEKSNQNTQTIDYGDISKINQVATLGGFIRVSQSSLKESVDKTNAIAEAFKNNKRVIKLNINQLPVDVRPDSSIENETSSNAPRSKNSDRLKGHFEIQFLMQGRDS